MQFPTSPWLDDAGQPIQAHGGCILRHGGRYYWYGENKAGKTRPSKGCEYRVDFIGISCYSSEDLFHWHYEGLALAAQADMPAGELHPSRVVERPKVLYNAASNQFVMWMHIDDESYSLGKAGVAVSAAPAGPFRYLDSCHPNGTDSRDLTLFAEEGNAYLVHSSDRNRTMRISALTEDFLGFSGAMTDCFTGQYREAPCVCKADGRYYMISSGCTGWYPNTALYADAPHMMGGWVLRADPCLGRDARKTYGGQGCFVLPLEEGAHMMMFDLWNPKNLADSRYLWLPLCFYQGEAQILGEVG